MSDKYNRAADCVSILDLLAGADADGLSMEEIGARLGWSCRTTNDVLCDLSRQVGNHKVRDRSRKVTKYFLKPSRSQ